MQTSDMVARIMRIADWQIINAHLNMCHQTKCNVGYLGPISSCGIVANAMMWHFPDIMNHYGEFKYQKTDICKLTNEILANNKNSNMYVYRVTIFSYKLVPGFFSSIVSYLMGKNIFDGHAYVIAKIAPNRYIFVQSYIGQYRHTDCTKEMSLEKILSIMSKFEYILKSRQINQLFVIYWKYITDVDISHLLGFRNSSSFEGEAYSLKINN